MTRSGNPPIVVAALYAFRDFKAYKAHQAPLLQLAQSQGVMGTLLLASEGVNGTIAGSRAGIDAVLAHIQSWPGFADLEWKESSADEMPFLRMKVRLKSEIVTMGVAGLNPAMEAGTYVDPKDWNALIARDDVIVIDTRNDYEVAIGTFEGAVDPETDSFREFPAWSDRLIAEGATKPKVAMFCTGGIRCEKATAYLKSKGVPEVYHLRGGILKYLEEVDKDDSLWHGECFVFDRRVSVGHGLSQGTYQLCSICRRPFHAPATAKVSGGVATTPCPACEQSASEDLKARAKMRQKQIELADARGTQHLGPAHTPKRKSSAETD